MQLLSTIHKAEQVGTLAFAEHTGSKVTVRQATVLGALKQNPGVSQTALVEATGVDRSTLADLVKRMMRKGWLTRRRTREDARAYAVKLTSEGLSALNDARKAADKAERVVIERFPQLAQLAQLANGK